nr:uncharacterized protein LOC104645111 [Solanum lycopersicum]
MKDLGNLRFFLGIEFARSQDGIVMHQRKYTLEIISEAGLSAAKPAATPLDPYVLLTTREYDELNGTNKDDKLLTEPTVYRSTKSKELQVYCDSDVVAYIQGVAEVVWLVKLFKELGAEVHTPITIYSDSKSAIQIAANPVFD